MSVRILFLATGYKERMKLGDKILLKQEEKQKFRQLLNELRNWIEKSDEEIKTAIITPYNEIYEISVQNHFEVLKNEFAKVSEGSMIRFGIEKFPAEESYLIVSSSDTKLFRSEIFEELIKSYKNNSEKIIFSKLKDKLRLPIIFSGAKVSLLNSLLYQEKGKFVFKATSKNSSFCSMDNILTEKIKPVEKSDYSKDETQKAATPPKKVIVIRGAGRLASSVAITLHKFGIKVIMTEQDRPSTLFKKNSFAAAVTKSKKKMKNVRVYLVALTVENIIAAFENDVIPLVIDPDLKCLNIFKGDFQPQEIFKENNGKSEGFDPLARFKEEITEEDKTKKIPETKNAQEKIVSDYEFEGIIDLTSKNENKKLLHTDATITIGTKDNSIYEGGPKYIMETSYGLSYGRIIHNTPYNANHIDKDGKENEVPKTDKEESFFSEIVSPRVGVVKLNKRIGDAVFANDTICQIEGDDGDVINIDSKHKGYIVALKDNNEKCREQEVIALISDMVKGKADCFKPYPVDLALGINTFIAIDALEKHDET